VESERRPAVKRTWWLVALAIVAAFLLYVSFTGRTSSPRPQTQDDFPAEQQTSPPT